MSATTFCGRWQVPRHCIRPSGHDTADPSLLLVSPPATGKTSYECGDLQVKCCRFVSCLCPSIVNNPNVYWLRRKPVIDGSVHQVMGQNSLERSSLHLFSPLMHPLFMTNFKSSDPVVSSRYCSLVWKRENVCQVWHKMASLCCETGMCSRSHWLNVTESAALRPDRRQVISTGWEAIIFYWLFFPP